MITIFKSIGRKIKKDYRELLSWQKEHPFIYYPTFMVIFATFTVLDFIHGYSFSATIGTILVLVNFGELLLAIREKKSEKRRNK